MQKNSVHKIWKSVQNVKTNNLDPNWNNVNMMLLNYMNESGASYDTPVRNKEITDIYILLIKTKEKKR